MRHVSTKTCCDRLRCLPHTVHSDTLFISPIITITCTLTAVPGDPPANFTAHVLNSTSILLLWSEPTFPNGEILFYTVSRSSIDEFILNADTMEYLLTD